MGVTVVGWVMMLDGGLVVGVLGCHLAECLFCSCTVVRGCCGWVLRGVEAMAPGVAGCRS